ncbi:hypothetical protein V1515DRAFT_611632 [Lipomyces mesembrius]
MWRHVELQLVGGETVNDIEATIVICFEKGKKFETNDDRTVAFRAPSVIRPKTSSAQSSCCSSKLFEPGSSRTHRR